MLPAELAGKYDVVGTLGFGAQGEVLSARHRTLGHRVAIKLIRRATDEQPEHAAADARFRREALSSLQLSHPNIIRVHDYDENEHQAWIIMELVEGGSLNDRLKRKEPIPLPEIVRIMQQTLAALGFAHAKGVIHRDIKPANILLTADGTVKLADFGIAHVADSEMTRTGEPMGTPSYMAPEQFRGEPADARADLWSAGVVLYAMLTGERPFAVTGGAYMQLMLAVLETDPTPPSERNPACPGALDAVLARALAKRPEDRFESAAAFAEAIGIASEDPSAAPSALPDARPLPMRETAGAIPASPNLLPGKETAAAASLPSAPHRPDGRVRRVWWLSGVIAGAAGAALAYWFLIQAPAVERRAAERARLAAEQQSRVEEERRTEAARLAAELARVAAEQQSLDEVRRRIEAERAAEERARIAREEPSPARLTAAERRARAEIEAPLIAAEQARRTAERQSLIEQQRRIEAERVAAERARAAAANSPSAPSLLPVAPAAVNPAQPPAAVIPAQPPAAVVPAQPPAATPGYPVGVGQVFRDCDDCPELVVIPPGPFVMGSPASEAAREADEGPQHAVTLRRPVALGRYFVTVADYRMFVTATGRGDAGRCGLWNGSQWQPQTGADWRNPGFPQTDRDPVVCVNWEDAQAYARWLSGRTGQSYRLPTEAEWEYAARAGTTGRWWWGDGEAGQCAVANGRDQTAQVMVPGSGSGVAAPCRDGFAYTSPVGRFAANPFGLHDMGGNAWQWTMDCYQDSYASAAADASVPAAGGACTSRVLRGGSWFSNPQYLRSAARFGLDPVVRFGNAGFRVARVLGP